MKKIAFTIALILSLGLNSNVWAEGNRANEVNGTNNTNNTTVRTIKTPRFARPLVEKWIKEYAKTQPGVDKFLDWVLAQGTKYNHEFGLLNLK